MRFEELKPGPIGNAMHDDKKPSPGPVLPDPREDHTSVLAHQLRNSLNSMMMRVELLAREVGEGGSRHLDKLRQDIVRLDQTIEAMLHTGARIRE
jgi:hypothetical protein